MSFNHTGVAVSALLSVGLAIVTWVLARRALLHLPTNVLSCCRTTSSRGVSLRGTLIGVSLVALGIVLLFLPGPGVLLILIGLASCKLPGHARLLRWLLRRPGVLREVNALRTRHGRPPLHEAIRHDPQAS